MSADPGPSRRDRMAVDPRDWFPDARRRGEQDPFLDRLDALWAGRVEPETVAREAARLGLTGPLARREQALPEAPRAPTETELAQIATGADPAAGSSALDLVLGPWADASLTQHDRLVAVALSAFFAGDDVVGPPYPRWRINRPPPPRDVRDAVRAVNEAPLAPWRMAEASGDRARLEPALDLSARVCPDGPVQLRPAAQPAGEPGGDGLLFARVTRTRTGWVAVGPVAVPGPLPASLPAWLEWMTWRDRFERPRRRADLAGLLARRGHVLLRRTLEQRWRGR